VSVPLPGQVNFVAKSFPTNIAYNHDSSPTFQLLARLLSQNYLHREIREKGGAYGGGASFRTGTLSFYSYRDPHIQKTLDAYQRSLEWLQTKSELTERDLEEAKLSVFSEIDNPIGLSAKGVIAFESNISWEMQQKRREKLFATTLKQIQESARQLSKTMEDKASVAILGNPDQLKTFSFQ
jgi:Zn-dependent M16 (insulinase) family peptidase